MAIASLYQPIKKSVLIALCCIVAILITTWRTYQNPIGPTFTHIFELENNSLRYSSGIKTRDPVMNITNNKRNEYSKNFSINKDKMFATELEYDKFKKDHCYTYKGILYIPPKIFDEPQEEVAYKLKRICYHTFPEIQQILKESEPTFYKKLGDYLVGNWRIEANLSMKDLENVELKKIEEKESFNDDINMAEVFSNLRIFPVLQYLSTLKINDPKLKEKIKVIVSSLKSEGNNNYKNFILREPVNALILFVGTHKKVEKYLKKYSENRNESIYAKSIKNAKNTNIKTIYVISNRENGISHSRKLMSDNSKHCVFKKEFQTSNNENNFFTILKFKE